MAQHHRGKEGRLVKNYCLDMRECFECGSFLTCQAVDGIGLYCFKKMVKDFGSCSRHGTAGKPYGEEGQLLVECDDCKNEGGWDDNKCLIFDKNITRESCGCQKRHDEQLKKFKKN